MALRLYNTLTRTKEAFAPIDPAHVRMYVCGPTVYDFAHIGNARPIIVFDVLYRLLRLVYDQQSVTYVRNITDVDDKINARAAERGITIRELTDQTNAVFQADVKALGCLEPDVQPRATEHIVEMRDLIEKLVQKGFAYVAEEHVLFSPAAMDAARGKLPRYGALANRSLDEMIAGARVDVAPYKREATDFVLWKPSKAGEPSWPSPCGIATEGRPGWHIECSAMSWKRLIADFAGKISCEAADANVFDIHGGGIDLVFPHHENEIAQSCCALDASRMANVWMHNGFLQVEGEKMSKSLGNFITINELLTSASFGGRKWHGDVLRLAMLRTHYRQPIDWTVKSLEEAEKTLDRWYGALENLAEDGAKPGEAFMAALQDDLNTPGAIAELFAMIAEDPAQARPSARLLGLLQMTPAAWGALRQADLAISPQAIEALIEARLAARAAKNWAESDRIRDELAARGVALKDAKDPATGELRTTWEAKR
jgi:cysteinyl-tRNA synthetase